MNITAKSLGDSPYHPAKIRDLLYPGINLREALVLQAPPIPDEWESIHTRVHALKPGEHFDDSHLSPEEKKAWNRILYEMPTGDLPISQEVQRLKGLRDVYLAERKAAYAGDYLETLTSWRMAYAEAMLEKLAEE